MILNTQEIGIYVNDVGMNQKNGRGAKICFFHIKSHRKCCLLTQLESVELVFGIYVQFTYTMEGKKYNLSHPMGCAIGGGKCHPFWFTRLTPPEKSAITNIFAKPLWKCAHTIRTF